MPPLVSEGGVSPAAGLLGLTEAAPVKRLAKGLRAPPKGLTGKVRGTRPLVQE